MFAGQRYGQGTKMTEAVQVKDLGYYVGHPDELPEDEFELAKLSGYETDEDEKLDDTDSDSDGVPSDASDSDEKGEDKEDKSAEKQDEQEFDGIVTKDGKHVMPFDRFKEQEARRIAAEQMVEELKERVSQLQEAKKSTQEAPRDDTQQVSDETLDALKAEFPELYAAFEKQSATITKLEDQLKRVVQSEESRQQKAMEDAAAAVQRNIDENPALSYWQQNDKTAWDLAVAIDNQYASSPKLAHLSQKERFEKVVQSVVAAIGAPPIEDFQPTETKSTKQPVIPPKKQKKQPSAGIHSLSDIPGGAIPDATDNSPLETKSPLEYSQWLSEMSDAKREAYFNSL